MSCSFCGDSSTRANKSRHGSSFKCQPRHGELYLYFKGILNTSMDKEEKIHKKTYTHIYTMPDYSKGEIYKISNTIDDDIYVGSTCETLVQRMAKHRSKMKPRPQGSIYNHMHGLGVKAIT